MGPEFNEKMQWARYLQLQHDEERRKERARMEQAQRMEEEFKKTHYESVEELTMEKYYDYEVEEEEEKPKESTDWSEVVLAIVYWGGLFGILIYAIIRVVNGG